MKALIVEDDITGRLMLQKVLRKYGECHIAVNGKEAVRAAARALLDEEPYNLICLDIMMPEMDGHEALRKIRAAEDIASIPPGKEAKIIMITALHDVKSVASAYKETADAYFVKPIDFAKLIDLLETLGIMPTVIAGS